MKLVEIKESLSADTVGKDRSGHIVARWGFFYTHGKSAQTYVEKVKAAFPGAVVHEAREVWKSFRGGAPTAQQSHFLVAFTPAAEVLK